jgi:hypothetical protein
MRYLRQGKGNTRLEREREEWRNGSKDVSFSEMKKYVAQWIEHRWRTEDTRKQQQPVLYIVTKKKYWLSKKEMEIWKPEDILGCESIIMFFVIECDSVSGRLLAVALTVT